MKDWFSVKREGVPLLGRRQAFIPAKGGLPAAAKQCHTPQAISRS
jgi:hypothetical protein